MIRSLAENELPEAAALAAAAFREDSGFAHILPDDAQRRWRLPSLIEAILRAEAARGGEVFGAFEDGALIGMSLVLPPGAGSPDLADWTRQLPLISWLLLEPAALLRALGMGHAIESLHPKTLSYLKILAVHPATQGRGVGAALLNAAPKELYLETFEPKNVSWYEARGFRTSAEIRSSLRPPFWTLRRSR